MIPLIRKLRKKIHKDIASGQDILMVEAYKIFPSMIIHGGTAVWRCYGSNRFSEDVDVFLNTKYKREDLLEKFRDNLTKQGFKPLKFKMTDDALFSKFSFMERAISFEAIFKNVKKFVTKTFELVDGNFINVYTLEPEELIAEKVEVFLERFKIRDLYDIYFLLNFVSRKEKVKSLLTKLLKNFRQPKDTAELKTLIIVGSIPKVEDMLTVIRAWVR